MLSNVSAPSSLQSSRRYILHELIHRGANTVIYRGDLQAAGQFARPMVVKLNRADLAGSATAEARLRDEARLLGAIRHRAIVAVHGVVTLQGRLGLVMEHVPGADLATLARQGQVPVASALEIIEELSGALDVAWRVVKEDGQPLHLTHRSISARSVRLTPEGAVKLLGFDFARADMATREAGTRALNRDFPLAPELFAGDEGAAADVYALGALLYQLVHGEPLPRMPARPEAHALALQQALDALEIAEPVRTGLESLLYKALAFSAAERPCARELQRAVSALRRKSGGVPLAAWVAGAIRRVPASVRVGPEDPLVGIVFAEGASVAPAPKAEWDVPWTTLGVLVGGAAVLATGLFAALVPILLRTGLGPLRALLAG